MSLNVSESYASWSKMFWWETTTSQFAIVSRFLQAHRQTAVRIRLATQITFCVRGVISPLLANLYLHWLDRTWERRGFGERRYDAHIVRYADDFVILCSQRPEYYLDQARAVLDRLGLTLNAKKTRILKAREDTFDFLGHRFAVRASKRSGELKTFYYPTPKAMKSVKMKIREVVRTGQHWDLPDLIQEKVNPVLRGWGNYFKTGNSRQHFLSIANYTTYTLCIMLRKKHKKRS